MEAQVPHDNQQTTIMDLPMDCLVFIFKGLDCTSDRESFGLTCHSWLHIQNTCRRFLQFNCSFTHRTRYPSHKSLTVEPFHLNRLLNRFQHLQSLCLSGCTQLTDSGLVQLQLYGSNLQKLYLDCCFGITDNGISLIASGCPSLLAINLYRCNVTDSGLEALAHSCSSLKDLKLAYCSLITDRGVSAISQHCPQLRSVNISYCRGISGLGFKNCPPTLSQLEAESCRVSPEGIMGIVSGGGLEFLNLTGGSLLLRSNGLEAIGAGFALRLKILNLRMCRTIGDESISSIATGCPLLEEWNLGLCHEVKVPGWDSIGKNCCNLRKLHVNRCMNLCDRGLQALREGCGRLAVLYIMRNCKVSDTAIEIFKILRGEVEIKEEEVLVIGPDWTDL